METTAQIICVTAAWRQASGRSVIDPVHSPRSSRSHEAVGLILIEHLLLVPRGQIGVAAAELIVARFRNPPACRMRFYDILRAAWRNGAVSLTGVGFRRS